jgi:hypothetical protein
MAGKPLSCAPVFVSASIPDPQRDRKYFETGDSIAIRDAVIALVSVVLPRTKLVFGGHPAITPLVKWVADEFGAFDRVRMFQSKFFQKAYIQDIEVFRYEEVEPVPGDRMASLLKMRETMLKSEPFGGAFFIGGMEGVEHEYEMLKELRADVPRFPVYTTGGAARFLWQREWEEAPPTHRPMLERLRMKTNYVALFTDAIEGERSHD